MSDFLSSLTEKAQSALKSAGLTGQSDGDNGQGGVLKSHAVVSMHHQLRTLQQQYSSSVTPVQKIITTQKGIALDLDGLSNDLQAHSKELYTWSQHEEPDVKDVTDRLAWVNYIESTLARALATKIDASRAPFKALRDAENTLGGRRNIRVTLHNQIVRIEHDQQRGTEQRLAELKQQLHQAETNDEPLEREVQLLKRKAVRDSEHIKWQATREYAEKLLLLSQASSALLAALPSVPSADKQYHGAETTASVRASLQHALDNYKPGDITLPLQPSRPGDLSRSDTRSFGETHAKELSSISPAGTPVEPSIPVTPPPTAAGLPPTSSRTSSSPVPSSTSPGIESSPTLPPRGPSNLQASSPSVVTASPPLNPAALNQAPAPIPLPTSSPSSVVAPDPGDPTVKIPSITPTVAETGVPLSAGSGGPGPASGSLLDHRSTSPIVKSPAYGQDYKDPSGGSGLPRYGGGPTGSAAPQPEKYESAAEEKKRLEREEREKLLASGGGDAQPPKDDDLPPYQEF
ncbi:uncharacterized protein FIBRA_00975 [Fibroporia radiculosa]|uniref:Sphingolipid long chain base-responsive protein LSP1 n=1 Tax=Fibroporia radiculosa TaxID=599839 RepID=J4HSJ9_9APHY|nr:uncharacterized protein FIBRA_00975 [Fibroporia radiculosa]CCL98967.1 predicted protein [Fibroporia radiculosa]